MTGAVATNVAYGVLQITIHSGSGLSGGLFGKKDPYVVGQVGANKFHTAVMKNAGKNPKWEQTFSFPYKNESQISFRVLDKDHLSRDDLMGEGFIDISCLPSVGKLKTSIPIEKKKSPAGVLTCTIELKQTLGSYAPMPVPPTQENMNFLPSPPPYPQQADSASHAYNGATHQQQQVPGQGFYGGAHAGNQSYFPTTYNQQQPAYYGHNFAAGAGGASATGQYRSGGPPTLGGGANY